MIELLILLIIQLIIWISLFIFRKTRNEIEDNFDDNFSVIDDLPIYTPKCVIFSRPFWQFSKIAIYFFSDLIDFLILIKL